MGNDVNARIATINNSLPAGYQQGYLSKIQRGVCTTKAGPYTGGVSEASKYDVYQFFIPLNEIFPQLKEFPDDLIYLGLG